MASKRNSFYAPSVEEDEELELEETLSSFREAFESLNTSMTATKE